MSTTRILAAVLALAAVACERMDNQEPESSAAAAASAPGALLFARAYVGADERAAVAAHSVVAGPGGDIWMSGSFVGTVDFGAGPIENPTAGAFVTRFDPEGTARWTVRVDSDGAVGEYRSKGIAVDADGNAFVGSIVSLTKVSPAGAVLWSIKPVERPRGAMFDMGDIAADGAGGVVLLGWCEERLHFGTVTIPGGAFVLDIDGQGQLRWSNRFHQTSSDYLPIGLGVDGAGETVIAQNTNKGNLLRLTKIDAMGRTRWVEKIRNVGHYDVEAVAVAADPQGNTLFAGSGHARFGSTPVLPGGPWLAKLDPAGSLLWWKPLPIWAVTADPAGNVLLVSGHAATKLDPAGDVAWARDVLAGIGNAVITGSADGRMIVAGTFTGALDVEGNHLASGGGNAVVLMAFAP